MVVRAAITRPPLASGRLPEDVDVAVDDADDNDPGKKKTTSRASTSVNIKPTLWWILFVHFCFSTS